jgi:ribosome maturation protein SDO1
MPSAQINQPSNQIRLTNVSLVRLKKGKKRFEIACYKNTVQAFRSGAETDLDNVLQIPNVFLNVSKGQVAPNDEISKAFGKGTSRDSVIMEILTKGELQVGELERKGELERVHREVVEIVAGRLVEPKTKRVYTSGMIEKALEQLQAQGGHAGRQAGKAAAGHEDRSKSRDESGTSTPTATTPTAKEDKDKAAEADDDKAKAKPKPIWTGVTTTKSAKSQALDAMRALIAHQPIPVARARMRLRISCPTALLKQSVKSAPGEPQRAPPSKSKSKAAANDSDDAEPAAASTIKDRILALVEQVETQDTAGDEWECVGFVEPGNYKVLGEFLGEVTKGRARAEVLDTAVTSEES